MIDNLNKLKTKSDIKRKTLTRPNRNETQMKQRYINGKQRFHQQYTLNDNPLNRLVQIILVDGKLCIHFVSRVVHFINEVTVQNPDIVGDTPCGVLEKIDQTSYDAL